ncbi:MAG: PD-(D/E)XK nuclease family protein, partial [Defluviitaleaceae bacterium]|nr:PD-(D/E)XK nuclease family protein [Defluviitaleaceae bacterium]
MRLQYIFGGSGAGKTHHCLQSITEKVAGSTKPLIYIVPEQFTLESERLLCAFSPQGAVVVPQVLSFQRLSYQTLSKTGKPAGKLLDEVGKKMLLQKLLLRHRDELTFFAPRQGTKGASLVELEGFVDACDRTFREFAQYNITPEALAGYAEQVRIQEGERSILSYKLGDISRLYSLYSAYMSERYIVTEQAANFVPAKIAAAEFLEGCEVWIDGFTGFTAQEYSIIGSLLTKAEQVNIAMCIETQDTHYASIAENDPWAAVKQCITRISDIVMQHSVEILAPLMLTEKRRFDKAPELAFLEQNYLDYNIHEYPTEPCSISIASAQSKQAEVEFAAAEIISLVRDSGMSFSDIALVCASPTSYEYEIKVVFAAHDISFFLDVKQDIAMHPLAQLVCYAADVLAYDFRHADVFALLKTGLTPLERDDVDILENYAVKMGIHGSKWRAKAWTRGFDDNKFSEARLNALRNDIVQALRPFVGGFKRGKPASVREYAVRMFDMLEKLGIPERTEDQTFAKVLAKLTSVFEKMVEIMGDEEILPDSFAKILRIGVKSSDLGLIPPTLDQVIVGSAERTRLPRIAALIVLGANDGILPAKKEEDALLTDSERNILSVLGAQLAPDSRVQSLQSPFSMYSIVTQPEQFLCLSYRTDSDGEHALKPSVVVERVKSLFPKLAERKLNEAATAITTQKAMFSKVGGSLRLARENGNLNLNDLVVLTYFRKTPDFSERLRRIEDVSFAKVSRRVLSQKSLDMLYFNEIFTDVSRLERYMQCPFSYFAHYNLRLRPRNRFEAGAPDYGNFYHEILRDFGTGLALRRIDWRDLSAEQINEITDEAVGKIAPEIANGVLLSSPRYEYITGRAARIAKRSIWALAEHLRSGSFKPVADELGFGVNAPLSGIEIEAGNGKKLILQGRIDRVDVFDHEGKRYVKVIDYKSGNTNFNISDIYAGTQLQLITYLDVVIKAGGEYLGKVKASAVAAPEPAPGGMLYFSLNDPIIDETKLNTGDDVMSKILGEFKMSGLVLADKSVISAMDDGFSTVSKIIPVKVKKDGDFAAVGAKVATEERFAELRHVAETKTAEIACRMTDGDIDIKPLAKPNG